MELLMADIGQNGRAWYGYLSSEEPHIWYRLPGRSIVLKRAIMLAQHISKLNTPIKKLKRM